MLPGGGWSLAFVIVVFLLVAAKAHGRQVRLERERAGVLRVDFRKDNGPVVEAIWRHDRIRFWVAAVVLGACLVATAATGFILEGFPRAGAIAAAAAVSFGSGFVAAGLLAWSGQMRPRDGDPDWLRRANWASLGWWTLVAAALALVVLAS